MSGALERVIAALEAHECAPRRSGSRWVARCPNHDDRAPSFKGSVGRNGSVVVHCFAGCGTRDVLQELGLGLHDLFADSPEPRSHRDLAPRRDDRPPPPLDEVHALWDQCRPVPDDPEVSAWITGRGLDAFTIADRDLARALPRGADLPRWAWLGGRSWAQGGYRVVLPLYDASGVLPSVHARNVQGVADRDWAASNHVRERIAIDQLEHDPGDAVLFLDAVYGSHVRMIHRRQQFGFTLESTHPVRIA